MDYTHWSLMTYLQHYFSNGVFQSVRGVAWPLSCLGFYEMDVNGYFILGRRRCAAPSLPWTLPPPDPGPAGPDLDWLIVNFEI